MLFFAFIMLVLVGQADLNLGLQYPAQQNSFRHQLPAQLTGTSFKQGQNYLAFSPGDQFAHLDQLASSSKRARKMSAFMPMRGRKDGRTAAFADDSAVELVEAINGNMDRLIGILLKAEMSRNQRSGLDKPAVIKRYLSGGQPTTHQPDDASRLNVAPSMLQLESPDDSLLVSTSTSSDRLQRAFAPMRGKRLDFGQEEEVEY